jgi:hypothetical protein
MMGSDGVLRTDRYMKSCAEQLKIQGRPVGLAAGAPCKEAVDAIKLFGLPLLVPVFLPGVRLGNADVLVLARHRKRSLEAIWHLGREIEEMITFLAGFSLSGTPPSCLLPVIALGCWLFVCIGTSRRDIRCRSLTEV